MSVAHASRAAMSILVAAALLGCGGGVDCCAPLPQSESLMPIRWAELTPAAVRETPGQGVVGRSGGTPFQVVLEFEGGLTGGGGTYVDDATLSFFVHAVLGDPPAEFGRLRVELVDDVGSGLGDPLSAADYDERGGSWSVDVAVPVGAGRVQVDVADAVRQHVGIPIAFRLSFPGASSAATDASLLIAMEETVSDPPPKLDIDGGILGH